MADIIKQRMTAELEGDFVVFLIGMRINKLWKINKWFPVTQAMTRMLTELSQHKEMGLLGFRTHFGVRNIMVVQYWRSFEQLATYAGSKDAQRFSHFPAWVAFNKSVGSNGDVGIWHETYRIGAGQYESVYNNMPAYGLGTVGTLVSAVGRKSTAAGRIQAQRKAEAQDETAQ